MYIIVEYISSTDPSNINLVMYGGGEVALFETRRDATKYAEEMCAWKYRIVQL